MNDCPNGDVRDLLPDYLHDRLDVGTRAMVDSHLAGCADCRAEVALLRDLRATLSRTPAIDVGTIAAAMPSYRAPVRRSWVGWRTAAAVTLIVAGGSSLVVVRSHVEPSAPQAPVLAETTSAAPVVPAVAAVPDVKAPAANPAPGTPTARTPAAVQAPSAPVMIAQGPARTVDSRRHEKGELAMGGGTITDLSDSELASLLKDIDNLDAVPSTDVDVTPTSPIAPTSGRRRSP